MKPPKSIRNIVNSFLGKKTKSVKNSDTFNNSYPGNLDKNRKHHRSADDLLNEEPISDYNANRLPRSSVSQRSRSVPRRSQSCLNVRDSSQRYPAYGRKIVGGQENDFNSHQGKNSQYNQESTIRSSSSFARTHSRNSFSNSSQNFSERPRSQIEGGNVDELSHMASWSHPQFGNTRTVSASGSNRTQSSQYHPRRFPPNENLLSKSNQSFRSDTSKDAAEEKLRTCLQVLDRLSAQVKEIKDVSRRVKYVDTKVKTGSMERGERERRLRELDMAEAASQRLKNMIKSGVEEMPSSTRHSSLSSGYDSENTMGSGRSSTIPQNGEPQRTSRPPTRNSNSRRSSMQFRDAAMTYQASQPYPQSVYDMMSIWDAKELANRSQQQLGRHMTREDSTSSGYATGSGSEDGRRDSPNATDLDSIASMYSMQGGQPEFHQKQEETRAWNQQHFPVQHAQHYAGYPTHQAYDPYAIYGTYPQYKPQPGQEDIYGNYEGIYGYATSSVYDHEIYSNGWYQLPSSGQSVSDQYHQAMPASTTSGQGWAQMSYVPPTGNTKHGGLSDLFYDPTAQSDVTLMESIAKEVAMDSQSVDDSTWKSYGSFRYRNGERTITAPTYRKRKTVRFSQTVRQRVETEESEMEDSTSVIKGGMDEEATKEESKNEDSTSEIYMWPRQDAGTIHNTSQAQGEQQKTLPEPIYEFPSGHIESSCMCSDCILARSSCQMQPAQAVSYY